MLEAITEPYIATRLCWKILWILAQMLSPTKDVPGFTFDETVKHKTMIRVSGYYTNTHVRHLRC